MTLGQLLPGYNMPAALQSTEVLSLTQDSRQIEPGAVFFCIAGHGWDGHNFAKAAVEAGAVAVVVQRDVGLDHQIVVDCTATAYATACANFYGNPSKKLTLIGVTGTNGKTTICYLVKSILESAGKKVGLIGTVENLIGSLSLQARYTTPEPKELNMLFARMVEAGCEYVVMEVSSHAMDQNRLAGCHFSAAGFTNLTPDHLDYHGTMEAYFEAKSKLFAIADSAVVNADDPYGRTLADALVIPTARYSIEDPFVELWADEISFSQQGSQFCLHADQQHQEVQYVQPGEFSVSNVLCAAGLCLAVGLTFTQVVAGVNSSTGVAGRFERLAAPAQYTVMRDFAHSADSLEKILQTIRSFYSGNLITVFGCAGERDRKKRSRMADVVAAYSDHVVMTADNPRREPVEQIFADALPGLEQHGKPYEVIANRFDAIQQALQSLQAGDYLLLAGKGHEDYQVLADRTLFFDEREIVADYFGRFA